MATEQKDSRKKRVDSFLPDEMRLDLIGKLEGLGIDVKDMTDADMLKKIGDVANEERELRAQESAKSAFTTANSYCMQAEKIKDKEFALRLFNLGVPVIFCKAFDDDDKKLTDEQIWRKVSRSGISQFRETKDIFSRRSIRPEKEVRD